MKIIALMVLMLMSLSSVATEIYKWKDANGNTVYGEKPPQDVNAKSMNAVAKRAVSDKKRGRNDKERLMKDAREAERAKLEAEEAKKQAAQEKEMQEYCDFNRKRLETLQKHARIRQKAEDGSTKILLSDEREAQITETQKNLQKHCS